MSLTKAALFVPIPHPWALGETLLELLHPRQHIQVPLTAQLPVVTARVPWVEGVESDHIEGLQTTSVAQAGQPSGQLSWVRCSCLAPPLYLPPRAGRTC